MPLNIHTAEQTHLLSLNAAVKAEKTEEFGRGFTVVAQKISTIIQLKENYPVRIKRRGSYKGNFYAGLAVLSWRRHVYY